MKNKIFFAYVYTLNCLIARHKTKTKRSVNYPYDCLILESSNDFSSCTVEMKRVSHPYPHSRIIRRNFIFALVWRVHHLWWCSSSLMMFIIFDDEPFIHHLWWWTLHSSSLFDNKQHPRMLQIKPPHWHSHPHFEC